MENPWILLCFQKNIIHECRSVLLTAAFKLFQCHSVQTWQTPKSFYNIYLSTLYLSISLYLSIFQSTKFLNSRSGAPPLRRDWCWVPPLPRQRRRDWTPLAVPPSAAVPLAAVPLAAQNCPRSPQGRSGAGFPAHRKKCYFSSTSTFIELRCFGARCSYDSYTMKTIHFKVHFQEGEQNTFQANAKLPSIQCRAQLGQTYREINKISSSSLQYLLTKLQELYT